MCEHNTVARCTEKRMCVVKKNVNPQTTYEMYGGGSSPLAPLSPPSVAADPPFFVFRTLSRWAISSCCVSAIKLNQGLHS